MAGKPFLIFISIRKVEQMKVLTISIAAYNVEKTLNKTLDSLNDSRFLNDIEVLIIDDGSKDGTREVAMKYQTIAPDTFKYVKKENGGHGSTINKGIELATGKYFKVLDGDDWINTEKFNTFIKHLKNENADLVLTKYARVFPDGHEEVIENLKNFDENKLYNMNDKFDIPRIEMHMITVKTRLLKKNNVKITENSFYVDQEYNMWSLYLAQTLKVYGCVIYMYRFGVAEQSVSKEKMLKNVNMQENIALNLMKMYKRFKDNGNMAPNKDELTFSWVDHAVAATMRTYLLMDSAKKARKKINKFDQKIEANSQSIFDKLNKDWFIRTMRSNGIVFWLVRIAYLMYKR